jgi:hypothetical protein
MSDLDNMPTISLREARRLAIRCPGYEDPEECCPDHPDHCRCCFIDQKTREKIEGEAMSDNFFDRYWRNVFRKTKP